MPVVLGLCGYATAGKDEATKGLVAQGWERVSFADGLRTLALKINPIIFETLEDTWRLEDIVKARGWHGAKKHGEVRRLLQAIGTEAVRGVIGDDAWVNRVDRIIDSLGVEVPGVVIPDVRFPNEVECVYRWGVLRGYEAAIVRITRPGVGPVNNHISETAIDDITPDFEIINDGTPEELQRKLVEYAESLSDCSKVAE
jgi:hypothetical protein